MEPHRLTVAVLTFRREEQLRSNLEAVRQRVHDAGERVAARILVVDNDPDASARATVTAMRDASSGSGSVEIVYAHEPQPGIPAARNRALSESDDARLLVFIDDDEIPQPGWLTSLIDVWERTRADAVVGRVVSLLPSDTDPWVVSSGFFRRTTHETGTVVPAAATNNLLLDLDTVRSTALRFDETLGLTGGEDTVFTRTLTRRGGTIVWCQESVAIDPVVQERATREWVLQRAFAHGNVFQHTRHRLESTRAGRARTQCLGVVGGAARIAVAAATHVWAGCTGRTQLRQQSEIQLRRGWGVLAGGLGHRFEEYRRAEPAS